MQEKLEKNIFQNKMHFFFNFRSTYMTRLMSLGSLMPGASSKGLSSPRSARPSGLTCWRITRPQVSGMGTPVELTAESILRVRILNFGAQKYSGNGSGQDFCVKSSEQNDHTATLVELTVESIPRIRILARKIILNYIRAKFVIKFGENLGNGSGEELLC